MTLKIIHVQWVDSQTLDTWRDVKELDHDMGVIHTVGLLVHQDADSLFIASTYDGSREAVNAAIWIPRSCIKTVVPLGSIEVR